ncbi:MAG: ArnT family glycosyltransferase [Phycisphaerales bacterium]
MRQGVLSRAWVQSLIVVAVCAVLYWPLLGTPGFGMSEGHRVVPAWTMLETGRWLKMEMFGQTYLRKPPGFPWAIALASMVFGKTEFAARAVSAASCTVMALTALWYSRRWFGDGRWRGPLGAGVAQAIMPQFVAIGRVAEIDALNALGTQFACLALIDLARPDGPRARLAPAGIAGAGILIAGLAKGPASATCLLGVMIALCVGTRSIRALANVYTLGAIGSAAAAIGVIAWLVARANAGGGVTQDFSEFTWSFDRLGGTLRLIPAAFVAALPASIALVPLLAERLTGVPIAGNGVRRERELAHIIGFAWLLSVGLLMLMGISNSRYAMPAAVLLPPLVAYTLGLAAPVESPEHAGASRVVREVSRWCVLRHPLVIPIVLVPLLLWWSVYRETYRDRREAGRRAGAALAASLIRDGDVWANDLVEARPDVLLYMQRASRGRVTPLWMPEALRSGELPRLPVESGRRAYLLLRSDSQSAERDRYAKWIAPPGPSRPAEPQSPVRLHRLTSGRAASYEFELYEVE